MSNIIQGDTYRIHYFGHSATPPDTPHGDNMTLDNHSSGIPLPPPGLFSWHYLQCVFLKFGTKQYMTMAGLAFSQMPFRTQDDIDAAGGDDETSSSDIASRGEPPWPTYWWDRRAQEIADLYDRDKRMKWVRSWIDDINS
jgi:hypothetical protein